ncbi:MG2 domain-containing protein [Labilibaculum sp. DW002]|uniref:MG2 domain-containing protein n=1 Tax=Paralabilibaculum antarcticum TaxID=2912572 RepID=A0ABT5VUT0_9BACT|nr:MG2 domain-containing protein [Labilibaculum sp. DW002]MDE5419165.1 MG2 domain-containing protein [Labilibaculum sp. DW002]
MRKNFYLLLSLAILIPAMFSCKDKKNVKQKVDPGFGQYISAFTSGVVSSESIIQIRLVNDYAQKVESGQELEAGIVKITPAVKGKAYWKDARCIEFRAETRMKSDTKYKVNVNLSKLMEVPAEYSNLKFNFQTIKQTFTLTGEGLQSYDKTDMLYQKYKGYITTADVIVDDEIESVLEATLNSQKRSIEWMHSADGKQHHFVVDSLKRQEEKGELSLEWNGSSIGVDEKGEKEVEIPALNVFKVMSAKVIQQPEQYVSIRFSDPLKNNQKLDGLVRIEGQSSVIFIIDGNELRVFPTHRLSGTKTIRFEEGIRNAMDYSLKKSKKMELTFEDIKPAVRLIGNGIISPSSQGLMLPFEAVSLKAVDLRVVEIFENNVHQYLQDNRMGQSDNIRRVARLVLQKRIDLGTNRAVDLRTWNAYTLDVANYITVNPGAIYRLELRFRKEYAMYACEQEEKDELVNMDELIAEQQLEKEMKEWDQPGWYESYYYPEGYRYSEKENPCHVSYYRSGRFVKRTIFASDLGIIAKAGNDKSITFAISNLISAEPEAAVELEVYNYQNQLMANTKTDKDGLAKVQLDRKPFLLVAKKGNQRGYLRLEDGSALSLSNFDVRGQVIQKGIKGYIYGERGVWRPGDNLYLTFVLEDEGDVLPDNHPVVFELINPQGQTVTHKVSTGGANGFYSFVTPTDVEAPTGDWSVRIKVGGATFRKNIKIETVKPNRLKINLDFGTDVLKSTTKDQKAEMEVKWLHGAIARDLKSNISLRLAPTKTSFEKYPAYIFDDPSKEFYADEQVIFDGKIDQSGKATVALDLKGNKSAPGMLNANFITRVFEKGGDFSIDMQRIKFAPYESFIGLKMPESERGWFLTDTDHDVKIVTLDADGNPVSRKNVIVKVYKIDWRWWWDAGQENLASYIGRSSTSIAFHKTISTENGVANLKLNIPYHSWQDYGRYLIQVVDKDSGHSAGQTAYFSKWYGRSPEGMPGNASMLSFTSDKDKYSVGEKARVTIPSSKSGKALVSIETGAKVLQAFWVDTKSKESEFSFDITPEMAPNAYVSVTLVQPHAQTENDLPIRMYGVIPILVEDPNTRLSPVIDMPDVLEPEKEFKVTVSEKDGKAMTYTLAVVDDGLLDLTRFRTPNPWNTFYAREALGVKTWDMYDLVMGAYGARLEKAFAIGGDEDAGDKKQAKANRFKPVVMFYGPYTLYAGDSKLHKITMPNYVGSVRTMVVSGYKGAYGSAEKTTQVRKPLMILATLPRVVGPSESVKLPVTVFAMDPKIKNVKIKVVPNEFLTSEVSLEKTITFDEVGEQVIDFDLKVASRLGIAKVKVLAESGNVKTTYDIELDVRNPNPRVVNVNDTLLKAGASWNKLLELPGMQGTNKGVLELSNIPPIDFGRRLQYLIGYPHGCIEQTTSSVFPQLFLDKVVTLSADQKSDINTNVQAGLNRLLSFQIPDGGFSYWPGGNYGNDWGTSYAGHFMLKAEELGYTLPMGLKSAWLRYQKSAAKRWESSSYRGGVYYSRHDLLQAYRLYTLAVASDPDLASMNRLREQTKLSSAAKWRLAAAYQLIGQKEVAEKLIENLGTEVKAYREHSGSFGSDTRDRAMILETLSLLDKRTVAFPMVQKLSEELSGRSWMSTQTTAFCLIGMAEFAGRGESKQLNVAYSLNGEEQEELSTSNPVIQIPLDLTSGKPNVIVTNKSDGILYARVSMSGIPETGDQTSAEKNLKMNVVYMDMNGNSIDVKKLQQGTDFKVEVRLNHPGIMDDYEQMALTQIFPSGWEIVNTRFGDVDEVSKSDQPTYQDIRDDRVYTYFDMKRNKSKTFTMTLNAAYVGKYYLPTVNCEAMYDDRVNARKPGQWVEVVK